MQADLFSTANLAATVAIPPAPALVPHHAWPFPGLSPEDSARAGLAIGSDHADMLAAVVLSQGSAGLCNSPTIKCSPTANGRPPAAIKACAGGSAVTRSAAAKAWDSSKS